jgi:hypothetical protein
LLLYNRVQIWWIDLYYYWINTVEICRLIICHAYFHLLYISRHKLYNNEVWPIKHLRIWFVRVRYIAVHIFVLQQLVIYSTQKYSNEMMSLDLAAIEIFVTNCIMAHTVYGLFLSVDMNQLLFKRAEKKIFFPPTPYSTLHDFTPIWSTGAVAKPAIDIILRIRFIFFSVTRLFSICIM